MLERDGQCGVTGKTGVPCDGEVAMIEQDEVMFLDNNSKTWSHQYFKQQHFALKSVNSNNNKLHL